MKLPKLKYYFSEKWVIKKCLGKSVLHLGCAGDLNLKYGPKASLHCMLAGSSSVLWGVDIDVKSLDLVKKWIPETDKIKYFTSNVENLENVPAKKFEVIVAGSIIEHLSNPGLMLSSLKRFMNDNSIIIIVTPHTWGILQFIRVALFKIEAVNPEHTCWYSIPTLSELLSRYNYVPVEFNTGYGFHPDSIGWKIKKTVGLLFFSFFPHLGGSLLAVFKLKNTIN